MLSCCLSTARLIIRDMHENDFQYVLQMYNTPALYSFATGINHPFSIEELRRKYIESRNCDLSFFCTAWQQQDCGQFIGCIRGFLYKEEQDQKNHLWLSMLMVHEKYLRQHYGKEITEALLKYVKSYFNISEVYISVVIENKTAQKFWTSMGFSLCRTIISQDLTIHSSQPVYIYKKCL